MIAAKKVVNWDIKVSLSNHPENGNEKYISEKQAIISCITLILKSKSSDFAVM